MSQLFTALTLNNLTLDNRIIIPPMCQYSAVNGQATPWHTIHYGSLSFSGAGLLIIEATAVEPEGRISDRDLGLWDDITAQSLAKLLVDIRQYSSMPLAIQLAHAGRKASTPAPWLSNKTLDGADKGWQPVAPSALKFNRHSALPQQLTKQQIKSISQSFVNAAKRAINIGFDAIELHAAHGYLLHEFLSPLSNQRDDDYGGSLENRMRLTLEIFSVIRSAIPAEKTLGVRISASDWCQGGWDLAQSIELTRRLQELGCDYIHVSSGGLTDQQQITLCPNYQVPFAQAIKQAVNMPTIAVGLITQALQAEAIVATGQADMVAIGRGILYQPHWPWQAAAELGAQVNAPPQYRLSAPHGVRNLFK